MTDKDKPVVEEQELVEDVTTGAGGTLRSQSTAPTGREYSQQDLDDSYIDSAPNACCAGEVRKVLEKAQEVKVRHLTSRDRYLSKSENFRLHQSNIDSCQEIVDFIDDLIRAAKEKNKKEK